MNPFKKLVKVCTTWRSSSSVSNDKEPSQWSAIDYINDQSLKEHMAHSPLMNSTQMWGHNAGVGQNSTLGMGASNAYNPNTMLHDSPFANTCSFTVEKVDNGFVLRSGSKAKVCKDLFELRDFFISIMVEYQLDK